MSVRMLKKMLIMIAGSLQEFEDSAYKPLGFCTEHEALLTYLAGPRSLASFSLSFGQVLSPQPTP